MEEKEIVEQPEKLAVMDSLDEGPVAKEMAPHEVGISKPSGTYGEFASPEQLFSAYQSLQSVFTKKAQELSELKRQQGNASVASCESPVVVDKEQVIKEYLDSVAKGTTAPAVIGSGANFLTNIPDPTRTMLDAGKLAKNFFSGSAHKSDL